MFPDGFLKIAISPNSFLMKKAYQHDNFIDQLLRLLLQHSGVLLRMQFFKYAVTYLLDFELSFKYFWSAILQIFSTVSRVFMIVTVAHCFVAICKHVTGVYCDGIDHVLFLCILD